MDLQLPETVFPERYYLGIFKQRAYQYHCMGENAHVIPLKLRVSIGGDDYFPSGKPYPRLKSLILQKVCC